MLCEPRHEGNIGAVARVMKNFDLEELILINPCKIEDEAYRRAMHASSVLRNAEIVADLDSALSDADLIVGTSGISSKSEKRHLRNPLTPREFRERVFQIDGSVAIIFGREDYGLYNEELRRCDLFVTIPASKQYPVLNISHAACIIFYELFQGECRKTRRASGLEKEKLNERFSELLDTIDYPSHKRENTRVLFRRLIGRAVPSKWEFHTLMGVLSKAIEQAKRGK